jgi:hypothetical protein
MAVPVSVGQFFEHEDRVGTDCAYSMNPDQLAELKNNEIVRKRLAKLMAPDCFRYSTKLEDMHAADQINGIP